MSYCHPTMTSTMRPAATTSTNATVAVGSAPATVLASRPNPPPNPPQPTNHPRYGPLLNGGTQVVFEGVPSYPTPSRMWEVVDKYKVGG